VVGLQTRNRRSRCITESFDTKVVDSNPGALAVAAAKSRQRAAILRIPEIIETSLADIKASSMNDNTAPVSMTSEPSCAHHLRVAPRCSSRVHLLSVLQKRSLYGADTMSYDQTVLPDPEELTVFEQSDVYFPYSGEEDGDQDEEIYNEEADDSGLIDETRGTKQTGWPGETELQLVNKTMCQRRDLAISEKDLVAVMSLEMPTMVEARIAERRAVQTTHVSSRRDRRMGLGRVHVNVRREMRSSSSANRRANRMERKVTKTLAIVLGMYEYDLRKASATFLGMCEWDVRKTFATVLGMNEYYGERPL